MNDEITEPTVRLCWNDFAIRGAVQVLRAAHLDAMADDMEAQLKPAEPIEFASVVREKTGMLFVRTGALIRQPWESGNDSREWTELKDPEVLRVGIGERAPQPVEELVGVLTDPEWHRLDVANAQTEAYAQGRDDLALALRKHLADLYLTVITAPEKRVADQALKLIAAALEEL